MECSAREQREAPSSFGDGPRTAVALYCREARCPWAPTLPA